MNWTDKSIYNIINYKRILIPLLFSVIKDASSVFEFVNFLLSVDSIKISKDKIFDEYKKITIISNLKVCIEN